MDYPKIHSLGSVVRSSEFSDRAINLYLDNKLQSKLITEKSKEAEEYLQLKNNEKGYVCIGDKFYISVYSY